MTEHTKTVKDDDIDLALKGLILKQSQTEEEGLDVWDKIRLVAQGLSLNTSDEATAYVQSLFSDKTYEELAIEEKNLVNQARAKDGSLKYEFAGALAPALALIPFSGGSSVPLALGNIIARGAGYGVVSSIADKEGSLVDRVVENPASIAVETGLSAVAGPILGKGVSLFKDALQYIGGTNVARKIRGQLVKPVEDKLVEIASSAQLSVDELIAGLAIGKTIPEISQEIARNIRGLYAVNKEAGGIISKAVTKRADEGVDKTIGSLEKNLVSQDKIGKNLLEEVNLTEKQLLAKESASYKEIFDVNKDLANPELNQTVMTALNSYEPKQIINTINATLKAKQLPPLFKVTKGKIELIGNVNLEQGDIIYRTLRDVSKDLFKTKPTLAGNVKDLSLLVKNKVDEISPSLKATRDSYRKIKNNRKTYDIGYKLFSKKLSVAESELNQFIKSADQDGLATLKLGISQSIKDVIANNPNTSKPALIRRLSNPESKDFLLISKLFNKSEFEQLVKGADITAGSLMAKNQILGQSQTPITQGRMAQTLSVSDGALAAEALSGNIVAGAGFLRKLFPQQTKELNQKQLTDLAKLIVTEDRDLLKKALTNAEARDALFQKTQRLVNELVKLETRFIAQQIPQVIPDRFNTSFSARASELDPNMNNMGTEEVDTSAIKDLTKTISPNTKKKILATQDEVKNLPGISFTGEEGTLDLESDYNLNDGNPPFVYKENYERYSKEKSR